MDGRLVAHADWPPQRCLSNLSIAGRCYSLLRLVAAVGIAPTPQYFKLTRIPWYLFLQLIFRPVMSGSICHINT
jgi:hypothetical protein